MYLSHIRSEEDYAKNHSAHWPSFMEFQMQISTKGNQIYSNLFSWYVPVSLLPSLSSLLGQCIEISPAEKLLIDSLI